MEKNISTMNPKEKLQDLCNAEGITISALEKTLGLGHNTLNNWDKSDPRITTAKKVADYFGVSVAYLMNWDDEISEKNALLEELLRNEDSRALMDAADGCTPEQIRAVVEMMKVWKRTSY